MLETIAQPIAHAFWGFGEGFCQKARILCFESYVTMRHVLPLSVQWFYHRWITHEIVDVAHLKEKTDNVAMRAFLYRHGTTNKENPPLLLVHGDYGHPFTLLHFAKEALREKKTPVFSLHLPECHRNDRIDDNSALMNAAIHKIQDIVGKQKVRIAAHSKGSILTADRILVKKDARIESLFAVGGRFHLPPGDESCQPLLRPFVSKISDAIHEKEEVPEIISIVPKEDWNAPKAAMTKGLHFHEVEGGHLGGLYAAKTMRHFNQWVKPVIEVPSP